MNVTSGVEAVKIIQNELLSSNRFIRSEIYTVIFMYSTFYTIAIKLQTLFTIR